MRPDLDHYLMALAETAATRSEDPWYQVGAVAATREGRVLATGYNGLPPGLDPGEEWWRDKEARKPFVIHAEQNLCSFLERGQASVVAVTLQPCVDCFKLLVAHGVERILYRRPHTSTSPTSFELARFYRCCEMVQVR